MIKEKQIKNYNELGPRLEIRTISQILEVYTSDSSLKSTKQNKCV